MNIFTMFIFKQMLSLGSECKNYKEDSDEQKKCIKLQILTTKLLEQFKKDNQKILNDFFELMKEDSNKKLIGMLYYLYDEIDNNINNYIDIDEQQKVLNELFGSLSDIEDYEFDFS